MLFISASAQKIRMGSCTTKDGGEYSGEITTLLLKQVPHGKGKTVYPNGDTYEGEYDKGKRQGYGVYSFSDGERYEGQWYQDQQHGKGIFYFANNNKYDNVISSRFCNC